MFKNRISIENSLENNNDLYVKADLDYYPQLENISVLKPGEVVNVECDPLPDHLEVYVYEYKHKGRRTVTISVVDKEFMEV